MQLYVYTDLKELQQNRPAVANKMPQHSWYFLTLQDTNDQFYEIVLGLPQPYTEHPSIKAIERSLTQHIKEEIPIKLRQFPGLSTLLRTAFVNQPDITEGTTLSALTEIIATASNAWDYCGVLVPEPANVGEERWLHIQEHSSKFPSQLKDKRVAIGQPLSGWCYLYRQSIVVEPTIENDPRLALFEEEGRPIAAAAIPAIADEEQRVVGVVYVARCALIMENQLFFSEELTASLREFGYVCGDIIAREKIEYATVCSMAWLTTHYLITTFSNLTSMIQEVVDEVRGGVNLEKAAYSWIYLLRHGSNVKNSP